MEKVKSIIIGITLLILFNIIGLITKILGLVIYPISYKYRSRCRKYIQFKDQDMRVLCKSLKIPWYYFILWLFLDDSIWLENQQEYLTDKDYLIDLNRISYPKWYDKFNESISDFLKAWHWSALRNSFINGFGYIAFGKIVKIQYEWIQPNKYYIRIGYHSKYPRLPIPYIEVYITSNIKIGTGFYKGNGRFRGLTIN